MSSPESIPLDANEVLNAASAIAAQQIAGLMRRNAELEATVMSLRRLYTEAVNAAPHPKPGAVGGD